MSKNDERSDAVDRPRIPADTFAHRLMLARAHAGHLSIREAADRCGLGRGAWTYWEKGGMPLDLDYVIEKISETLDVDPVWLALGGMLGEPEETRRQRARWSTVRPHTTSRRKPEPDPDGQPPKGGQATAAKLRVTKRPAPAPVRPTSDRPRAPRPTGRPTGTVAPPTLRRPVRL